MKGRASHGRQVPVPHVIPWFLWMSHCPQPIGLFNGIPQSSGFEHTSTGAYPAFLRFTGNVVPPFEEPRGSQLRLMRFLSQAPSKSFDLGGVIDEIQHLPVLILIRSRHTGITEFLVAHGLSFRPEHVHHATQLRKIIGVQTWGWFLGRWCCLITKL